MTDKLFLLWYRNYHIYSLISFCSMYSHQYSMESFIDYLRISNPFTRSRTYAYQRLIKVTFSEYYAYLLNESSAITILILVNSILLFLKYGFSEVTVQFRCLK